jgi:hypothetical protein
LFTLQNIEDFKKKHETEKQILQWLVDGEQGKILDFYGLDPLPKLKETQDFIKDGYANMNWDWDHLKTSEGASIVLGYILMFKLGLAGGARHFHASLNKMKEEIKDFIDIDLSRSKIYRSLKELEEKEVLESMIQTPDGTFYIFKLELKAL